MNPIISFAEAVSYNLHYRAIGFLEQGLSLEEVARKLAMGDLLHPPLAAEYANEFAQLVQHANRIGRLFGTGEVPGILDIPYAPDYPSARRFILEGFTELTAPNLGDPHRPLSTTLPFRQDSDHVPTLEELNQQLEQQAAEEAAKPDGDTDKRRKRRQRARYIRTRGEPVEYQPFPLMMWRTS